MARGFKRAHHHGLRPGRLPSLQRSHTSPERYWYRLRSGFKGIHCLESPDSRMKPCLAHKTFLFLLEVVQHAFWPERRQTVSQWDICCLSRYKWFYMALLADYPAFPRGAAADLLPRQQIRILRPRFMRFVGVLRLASRVFRRIRNLLLRAVLHPNPLEKPEPKTGAAFC